MRLDWTRDGQDWPNRQASLFVEAGGITWHVQQMGRGPHMLLVHGTGASTHSWRAFMPLLAQHFAVTALDLPGHGFTGPPSPAGYTLPGMSRLVADLVKHLGLAPETAIGHSAGAAILLRMVLDGRLAFGRVIGLNAALLPFRGFSGQIFAPLARLLASTDAAPAWFARRARGRGFVERLLDGTGSTIDAAGVDFYRRLTSNDGHVAAALRMMASWDLPGLARDLPRLAVPLTLVAGGNDRTVAPEEAFRVRDLVPATHVHYLRDLGHLAHEEAPERVAGVVTGLAQEKVDRAS